ncbi:MAG: energy transducer TonB [Bacteroidota bacterium]|nr:energy transducer TonB [Bacteroidota bacterium]
MQPEKILQSDVLDIVFEHKNKAYGAYELRKHYVQRLSKALLLTALLVVLIALLQSWKTPKRIGSVKPLVSDSVTLVELDLPQEEKPKERPVVVRQRQQVASIKYNNYLIVPDKSVHDTLPDITQLENSVISNITKTGVEAGFEEIVPPASEGKNGSGVVAAPATQETLVPLEVAEEMPEFPGGREAFLKFMGRNLRQPDDIDEGQKIVVIARFVVDQYGNISNIGLEQKGREDLDRQVITVIGKMPKWKPGRQNGRPVAVYFKVPVTFLSGD